MKETTELKDKIRKSKYDIVKTNILALLMIVSFFGGLIGFVWAVVSLLKFISIWV